MTLPIIIEEPITWKRIEVPMDIVRYCDAYTLDASRKDLRYKDCIWMNMGYYGTSKAVMKKHRDTYPILNPIFE